MRIFYAGSHCFIYTCISVPVGMAIDLGVTGVDGTGTRRNFAGTTKIINDSRYADIRSIYGDGKIRIRNSKHDTLVRGLPFIGDYDLKPPRQIFSIDNSVNLSCDNAFLHFKKKLKIYKSHN